MSPTRLTSAKIIQHAEGLGTPTSETVRKRAREIALINGRPEFNDEDWREAKRELHGGGHELHSSADGETEMTAMVSEHDMVAGSLGRHVPNHLPENTEGVGEELVAEGMDEAVHEQMLASALENPDLGDEE